MGSLKTALNQNIMKTDKVQERFLNELYTDSIGSEDEAVEQFIYLTNKNRFPRTTEANIIKCFHNRSLGSLLKRLDYTAFSASKYD
jgi:hypothetical protein